MSGKSQNPSGNKNGPPEKRGRLGAFRVRYWIPFVAGVAALIVLTVGLYFVLRAIPVSIPPPAPPIEEAVPPPSAPPVEEVVPPPPAAPIEEAVPPPSAAPIEEAVPPPSAPPVEEVVPPPPVPPVEEVVPPPPVPPVEEVVPPPPVPPVEEVVPPPSAPPVEEVVPPPPAPPIEEAVPPPSAPPVEETAVPETVGRAQVSLTEAVQEIREKAMAARAALTDRIRRDAASKVAAAEAAWSAAEACGDDYTKAAEFYEQARTWYTKATAPPEPGETRTFAGIVFVWCPPGVFTLGSPPEEVDRAEDETQHAVTLSQGFWLSKYEITQAQWEAVMGANPSFFKGADLPVDSVTWDEAQTFVARMNGAAGAGFRLPTEAEWEYACRAGTLTPFSFGTTISAEQANYDGTYIYHNGSQGVFRNSTTPVGAFPPNAWGLHDMHGNVAEWCQDFYAAYPEGPVSDPKGPNEGVDHVFRGGAWCYAPRYCRSAFRDKVTLGVVASVFGLRLAR